MADNFAAAMEAMQLTPQEQIEAFRAQPSPAASDALNGTSTLDGAKGPR